MREYNGYLGNSKENSMNMIEKEENYQQYFYSHFLNLFLIPFNNFLNVFINLYFQFSFIFLADEKSSTKKYS